MSSAARPALEFDELAANPSDAEEAVAWALECVLTPKGFAYAVHSREGHSMVAYENCPPGACPSGRGPNSYHHGSTAHWRVAYRRQPRALKVATFPSVELRSFISPFQEDGS